MWSRIAVECFKQVTTGMDHNVLEMRGHTIGMAERALRRPWHTGHLILRSGCNRKASSSVIGCQPSGIFSSQPWLRRSSMSSTRQALTNHAGSIDAGNQVLLFAHDQNVFEHQIFWPAKPST